MQDLQELNFKSTTTQGNDFMVYTIDDTIYYLDCFGDMLSWHNTKRNRQLVLDMVQVITTLQLNKLAA